jgi:hypothetical protein
VTDESIPLREYVEHRMTDDYLRLREQVTATERLLLALIDAKSTEFQAIHTASQVAIAKAEEATEKRFEAANEWRGQSSDRERSQAEAMARLTSTFARSDTVDAQMVGLRESVDAQLSELRRMVAALSEKISAVV